MRKHCDCLYTTTNPTTTRVDHPAPAVPRILLIQMATSELAATYAALILADDGIEITSDKIISITNAAGVELEPIWASLLAKALEGKNVKDLLSNVGSGGGAPAPAAAGGAAAGGAAAEAPKEEEKVEEKEESDDDMGFGLFD
ncbi:hypothetical protein Agabi119p4_8941 [Agaricus bisporus var. burnettii]|uniref:60S acidic ribosomal protein P1 n=2 Tax=Agaricus bisporus TaxID=5341 RepID=A0A8H7C5D4_AGABI|nr:hypothetical protein Agabi119p4_8941 [Agaricus bisporus var. burnettii]